MVKATTKGKAASQAKDTQAPAKPREPELLRKETHTVPVLLTDEELKLRGTEIGKLMVQRAQAEVEFEGVRQDHKANLKSIDRRVSDLSRALSTGTELRGVECAVQVDAEIRRVEIVRLDTGEVIGTRPLDPDERQRRLFRAGEAQAIAATNGEPVVAKADESIGEIDPDDDNETEE